MSATNNTIEGIIDALAAGVKDEPQRWLEHLQATVPDRDQNPISVAQILDFLQLSVAAIDFKRNAAIDVGKETAERYLGTMSEILNEPRFKFWFQDHSPAALAVSIEKYDAAPGLTHLVAMLARKMPAVTYGANPLAYFCYSYSSNAEARNGVTAMMKSLIAQLFIQNVDSSGVMRFVNDDFLMALPSGKVPDMCRLFANLIERVRAGTIICMIDGVDHLMMKRYLDVEFAMDALNTLVERNKAGRLSGTTKLSFKLLVTSCGQRHHVANWLRNQPELTISLDRQDPDRLVLH